MLLKNWEMTYDGETLDCEAPCSLYGVLYANGKIPDPFYGMNERELGSLSDKGCLFSSVFDVTAEMLGREYAELEFFGLDTICKITLNGTVLADVKNMHRAYRFDVKNLLREGENRVDLEFSSPTKYFEEMDNRHFLYTNGDTLPGAAHLRKALYMSGWDWGPTLPDMGIFRGVVLDTYNTDKIEDVFVRQTHGDSGVRLDISVETRHGSDTEIFAEIDGKKIKLDGGRGSVLIENPRLWWANGYGEQYLYRLDVTAISGEKELDSVSKNVGLRTLTVSTAKDKIGNEFCFVLNGVKIFAFGANYVPQDNIISRITEDRTEKLIKQCIDANFNCIRIWGGGYYPEDYFYDLCDRYGLIVWEDFMIACANVWLRKEFKEEIIAEAIYNIKRLRGHASLGLLCGNNEMETAVCNWGIADSALVKEDYLELYERILPELCAEYAPETFYWQSSPSSGGGFDDPECETRGDVHYWKVWHGGIPFTDYRNHKFRFCSEYGFESYPSMKTIETFSRPEDRNCFSRVMENHQKCKSGNRKILMYLADTYIYPSSFENLVYASQLLQADAIRCGVEHFRRIRGICMGSIYWQLNDCWPVASWSSIDSLGRYKALHYAAKKFYAPVAVGLFAEEDAFRVNVANEKMTDFSGRLHVVVCRNDFTEICGYDTEFTVPALSSSDVFAEKIIPENEYANYVYADLYDADGNFVMRKTELFTTPKHYEWEKPDIKVKITKTDAHTAKFEITSDCFAKAVMIDFKAADLTLSDNYVDVTTPDRVTVTAETELSAEELEKQIIVKSVYDIR